MADEIPTIFVKHGSDELVRHLQQYKAVFLVIGGTAVAVHGCRNPLNVDDFDILIEPTLDNAERIIAGLTAALVNVSFNAEALARPAIQIPVKVMQYWADILTPQNDVDFSSLLDRSVHARLSHFNVRVIGRSDLVAMKEQAAATVSVDLAKHQRDLQCLKTI